MKTNFRKIGIGTSLFFLLSTSCSNREAYNDGKWWAEEICKMLDNEDYDSGVTTQYMRMKYTIDNCEPRFYDFAKGFENYLVNHSNHQEFLRNQLQRMRENCKVINEKK